MRDTTGDSAKGNAGRSRATKQTLRARAATPSSTFEEDFGPGPAGKPAGAENREARPRAPGPIPGLACAGEDCVLKPAADLIGRFAVGLGGRGHGVSLSRAALSGIELMRALRDFLDEEIALAEKAAGKRPSRGRYEKIKVE